MEPFRAFVGDMLPSEQRTTGFATQSFFSGAANRLSGERDKCLWVWKTCREVGLMMDGCGLTMA